MQPTSSPSRRRWRRLYRPGQRRAARLERLRTGSIALTDFLTMLHTGQGMAWLGLFLGAFRTWPFPSWAGRALPSGSAARRRKGRSFPRTRPTPSSSSAARAAATWGFAATLQKSLCEQGMRVHVGPMSGFEPARWPRARRLILLAATYGDGEAPASAQGFLERFRRTPAKKGLPLAVLGFGDRSFPAYLRFRRRRRRAGGREGLDHAAAVRYRGPPVAAGLRPLGS